MYAIDYALKPDDPKNDPQPESLKPASMTPSPANDASARTDAALAIAKGHFIARGWRPLAIQPPALQKQCEDVSTLLLMNDAGETAWLSTRDWSALANPVDAFRREMVCVRAARVNQTILVYDGDFPGNVVEVAAQEPSLMLIDAAALRSMTPLATHTPVAAAIMAPTRRQRLTRPAQQAAHYVHDRLAHRLRQLNGERRRLKTLSTALLILVGASLGFLAFNMVIMTSAPETGDTGVRTVQVDPKPLPQPMPPSQGYVAQAAGVSGLATRSAYVSPGRPEVAPKSMLLVAAAPMSGGVEPSRAITDAGAGAMQGYEDVEQTQRRADAAMQVIAGSTREVTAAAPPPASISAASTNAVPGSPYFVRSADPAMADSASSPPDPAIVD